MDKASRETFVKLVGDINEEMPVSTIKSSFSAGNTASDIREIMALIDIDASGFASITEWISFWYEMWYNWEKNTDIILEMLDCVKKRKPFTKK